MNRTNQKLLGTALTMLGIGILLAFVAFAIVEGAILLIPLVPQHYNLILMLAAIGAAIGLAMLR